MITTLIVLFGTLVLGFSCAPNAFDTAHLHNVEKADVAKFDIARTGKSLEDICQFSEESGEFQFIDQTLIPLNWQVIEFKLKLSGKDTVFKMEIFNEIKPTRTERDSHKLVITPFLDTPEFVIDADYEAHLHQVNITVSRRHQLGFAVWDITVDRNISISTKQVQLRDRLKALRTFIYPSYGRQVYLVKSSTAGNRAYMNFTFDDPDSSKQYCFWFALSTKTPIDVYVNTFGAKQANKLTRLEFSWELSKDFCLPQYVYASQLGKFELSFVFDGHVTSEDALLFNFMALRLDKADVHIDEYVPGSSKSLVWNSVDGNVGWWYNNPSLFGDYPVVANCKTQLYICDILANCYPFERSQMGHFEAKHNETVFDFTLPQKYKNLISHSTLIRLYSDDPKLVVYQGSFYDNATRMAIARIESHLLTLSPKLQSLKASEVSISYQVQVHRQTRIPLSIPIDTIDLRVQRIEVRIEPYNLIKLLEVKVNGVNKLNNITHSSASSVSTADYIQLAPWQMANGHIKSFEIELEVVGQSSEHGTQMVDLKIEFFVGSFETSSRRHSKESPKFGDENCRKGPTYGDLDCHYDEYVCPEYYFKYDPIAKTCTRTDAPMLQ